MGDAAVRGDSGPDAALASAVQPVAHETRDRIITGAVTVIPIVMLGVAAWQVWNDLLHWHDLVVFAVLYVLTALGITVGFHRLFHPPQLQDLAPRTPAVFAALGSAAIEGPIISWVADHRRHHTFADKEGDPHSPHVGHGGGLLGALRGFFHAHVGWLFIHTQRGSKERFAPDLLQDPVVRFIDRTFVLWGRRPCGAVRARRRHRRHGGGGADRAAVGRGGADLPPAPRHLQHQFPLPHVRGKRDFETRRRVAQPRLARAVQHGGGLAQQPPRLPNLRRPRAAPRSSTFVAFIRGWRSSASPRRSSGPPPSARRPRQPPRPSAGVDRGRGLDHLERVTRDRLELVQVLVVPAPVRGALMKNQLEPLSAMIKP